MELRLCEETEHCKNLAKLSSTKLVGEALFKYLVFSVKCNGIFGSSKYFKIGALFVINSILFFVGLEATLLLIGCNCLFTFFGGNIIEAVNGSFLGNSSVFFIKLKSKRPLVLLSLSDSLDLDVLSNDSMNCVHFEVLRVFGDTF